MSHPNSITKEEIAKEMFKYYQTEPIEEAIDKWEESFEPTNEVKLKNWKISDEKHYKDLFKDCYK